MQQINPEASSLTYKQPQVLSYYNTISHQRNQIQSRLNHKIDEITRKTNSMVHLYCHQTQQRPSSAPKIVVSGKKIKENLVNYESSSKMTSMDRNRKENSIFSAKFATNRAPKYFADKATRKCYENECKAGVENVFRKVLMSRFVS